MTTKESTITRLAIENDAVALARLGETLAGEALDEATRINNLQSILSSSHDRLWVLEQGGELVAYLHAVQMTRLASPPFIEIVGLVVSPTARRQGYAAQLLQQVETWAGDLGLSLRVRCREDREQGNEFYRALGFSLSKRQNVYVKTTSVKNNDA